MLSLSSTVLLMIVGIRDLMRDPKLAEKGTVRIILSTPI
jgi:hypothetical protein